MSSLYDTIYKESTGPRPSDCILLRLTSHLTVFGLTIIHCIIKTKLIYKIQTLRTWMTTNLLSDSPNLLDLAGFGTHPLNKLTRTRHQKTWRNDTNPSRIVLHTHEIRFGVTYSNVGLIYRRRKSLNWKSISILIPKGTELKIQL